MLNRSLLLVGHLFELPTSARELRDVVERLATGEDSATKALARYDPLSPL